MYTHLSLSRSHTAKVFQPAEYTGLVEIPETSSFYFK